MNVISICTWCLLVLAEGSAFSRQDDTWASANATDVTQNIRVKDIVEVEKDYHYSSMAKPNPFIPPLLSTLVAKVEIPITSDLQRYKLTELNVVGIWTLRNGTRKSLIMTPSQEGVVASVGSVIGRRGGSIVKIEEKNVTVREFSLASDGTRQFEDFKLWLGNEGPKAKESIIIRSSKIGLPNKFGYGKKNYLGSTSYEKKRKDILDKSESWQVPKTNDRSAILNTSEEVSSSEQVEDVPELGESLSPTDQADAIVPEKLNLPEGVNVPTEL